MDVVDLGLNRKPGYSVEKVEKANILDNIIAIISIITYIADVGSDVFLAYRYCEDKQWNWFISTATFIVVPSIALQLFSIKWYRDDSGSQSIVSKITHLLQLGTIERYWLAFWYGLKTICSSEIQNSDYAKYLSNWRDVTMLRFFECFFESAPQVVLQLYIISTFNRRITIEQDWLVILPVILSLSSIAWSMVSYSHAFRLCFKGKGYGICGYACQILYRLFMISSRIAALVLFATEFSWGVIIATFIHWLIMIAWLNYEGSKFCSSPSNNNSIIESFLEKMFLLSIGFVYIFCFINIKEGTTRARVMAYYVLFIVENSLLIAVWYATRTKFEILEKGAICIIWGGFLMGIFFMFLHYRFFHPNQDITEGWCTCLNCTSETQVEQSNDEHLHPNISNGYNSPSCSVRNDTLQKTSPRLRKSLSIDIELSPQRYEFRKRNERNAQGVENQNARAYGTVPIRDQNNEVLLAVVNGDEKSRTLSEDFLQKSHSSYDMSGTVSKDFV